MTTLWSCVYIYICVHNTEDEEDCETPDLLITTQGSVEKETLQMYFEQFTEQFELAKHGNNSWILKLCSQSGMIYERLFPSYTETSVWGQTNWFSKSISVHHLHDSGQIIR